MEAFSSPDEIVAEYGLFVEFRIIIRLSTTNNVIEGTAIVSEIERSAVYKTILVPLDGSVRAEEILPHVEELARRFTAKVIFLNVVESPYSVAVSPIGSTVPKRVLFEDWTKDAENYLHALCDEFIEKGIEAERIIMYGPVVETIIDLAEREGVDLIAMASHGRSGLSRVFYGSVAAGVLHRVDRPLLLIRSRVH